MDRNGNDDGLREDKKFKPKIMITHRNSARMKNT